VTDPGAEASMVGRPTRASHETPFPVSPSRRLKFSTSSATSLFHGHEPLDTDTTAVLEGESWLMHNGYTQAEGVANLDQVAESGCLVTIGYASSAAACGGYARYIAICPPAGATASRWARCRRRRFRAPDTPLHWDSLRGMRVRR